MENTKVRVERRKCKRFRVVDGAFVMLRPSDTGAGRLINISPAGLMFEYVTTQEPSVEPTELEIFVTGSQFRLREVPCQSIWDLPVHKHLTNSLHKRRCGVQFKELSPHHISQLEYFFERYTIGAV
ncbi:MAG: PilZ domain-containing protein [Desulfobacterales bacterium]|jgi:hypothetical protein|nr:MAG: PilZ domain-containing protein [Desulfobacterales bacterium]